MWLDESVTRKGEGGEIFRANTAYSDGISRACFPPRPAVKERRKKGGELVRRYPYSNLSMLKQRDGTNASVIGIWSGICSVLLCTSGELPTAKLEEEQKLLAYALAHCTNQGKFNKFNSND
jgi:hypothetical protein